MFDALFSKYIVYTKVFQWLSFSPFMSSFLRRFTDMAPYIQDDIDSDSLNDLKTIASNDNSELDITPLPINSGTLALVFGGKFTKDGHSKYVAIKVLRKGIRQKIKTAIETVEFICMLLKHIPYINKFNFHKLIIDVKTDLLLQVDFKNETNNIKYVYQMCKKHKRINQQQTIDFLCTENCITMDFMEGGNILSFTKDEQESFIDSMVSSFVHLTFKKQIFHLDSHAGNILFNKENMKITFLDLGMMMKMSIIESNFLYDFVVILYDDFDKNQAMMLFSKYSFLISKNEQKVELILGEIFDKHQYLFKSKKIRDLCNDITVLLYNLDTSVNELNPLINKLFVGLISFLGVCEIMDGDDMKFKKSLLKFMASIETN